MTTFNDMIEKVWRRVTSGSVDATVQLADDLDATTTSFNVNPSSTNAIRIGGLLACGLEVMYITGWDSGAGTVTVVRGYTGSPAQTHSANDLVYCNPHFTRFDASVALNDELYRLSSPDNGLFQVGVSTVTYNPVYMGYDLGTIPTNFIDVLEIRHKIPFPTRNYPKISKWKVLRSIPDASVFPSGAGIVLYEGGYPGQPIYIQYAAPFTTVDVTVPANLAADVTSITGLASTMIDIPPLGAEIQIVLPREIRRNFMDVQPDPRKAPEVPSLAVSNSVQALTILYNERVSEEAARLSRQYTRTEGW
jgi:hypothetical protein